MTEETGQKQEAQSVIEKAEAAAQRMEEAVKKNEELLSRIESIETKRILAGRSETGSAAVVVDPEQAAKDALNARLKSTGLHV